MRRTLDSLQSLKEMRYVDDYQSIAVRVGTIKRQWGGGIITRREHQGQPHKAGDSGGFLDGPAESW